MRGVVFTGNRTVELQAFPDPSPGEGEVVLEIKASGMCGSDLHFYRAAPGEMQRKLGLGDVSEPNIAGHEPCGVVVDRGPGVSDGEAPLGARMMDHHYHGCGHCEQCRVGWSQLCGNGFTVYGVTGHGAHAQYMRVPASTLVPLPEALSFETGAAISCGVGTAFNALKRSDLSGRDTLAVYGQGPVGLGAVLLAKAMGARVIAVDIEDQRLALARQLGADVVVNSASDDPVEAVRDATAGRGADRSLDCSGHPDARVAALRSTRTWGTMCFVGEGGTVTLDVSQDVIRRQVTMIGSWTFSKVDLADCARFVAERAIDVDALFTQRYTSLEQATEAYELFDTQTTGKGVFLL